MAQQHSEIVAASAADIASDMTYHRRTYRSFLNLLKWAAAGSAAILVIVFFLLQSVPVERAVGGDPPPGVAEASAAAAPAGA